MSSAHEGRFDHMHTMLEAGRVVRLDLPLPDGLAAVRSTRVGTLAAAIQELDEATAAYDVERPGLRNHSPGGR